MLDQQAPHPAAPRQGDDRNGIVRDRIPSKGAEELLDHHLGLMAERDRRGNHCAHAGSGDEVDRDSRFREGLYHADMGERTRPAARQHETDRWPEDKPRHPRQIALIAAPDVNDTLAREVRQPTRAALRQRALRILIKTRSALRWSAAAQSIAHSPAPTGRLRIGGKNHPVRLPHAVTSPGGEIPAGEVNQERPAGGSAGEPLRFPLALRIIDDPDLPLEFTERASQTLGKPRIRQRLRKGYDRNRVDRLPQQAGCASSPSIAPPAAA